MAVSIEDLRVLGDRKITVTTAFGELSGRIVQSTIPDAAIVVMFASEKSPDRPLVLALDDIEAIVER